MNRPPIRFTRAHAGHIHAILSDLVPFIGDPGPSNVLGVDSTPLGPKMVPIWQVLDGTVHGEVKTAVYVITDDDGIVRYVGSINRRTVALRRRLFEHLAERGSEVKQVWKHVVLVFLGDGISPQSVLLCEGWVGRVLDPLDNDRLPYTGAPWRPRATVA